MQLLALWALWYRQFTLQLVPGAIGGQPQATRRTSEPMVDGFMIVMLLDGTHRFEPNEQIAYRT
jgi:hypothetical protein